MQKSSDRVPIGLVVVLFALTFLGKVVFDNLVYAWLMGTLQGRLGIQEAEVVAGFSSLAGPLLGALLVVYGLYLFLRRELEHQKLPEQEQSNRSQLVKHIDPQDRMLAGARQRDGRTRGHI